MKKFLKQTKQKGVPDFWIVAMMHHFILADVIKLHDVKALECLIDIKCCKLDNLNGFELDFIFDPERNLHFKKPVLTKTFYGEMERTIGTEIKWCTLLDECCLTREYNIRRKVLKSKKRESFFNLFNSTPRIDKPLYEGAIPRDYAIGLIIRDKFIPHAISWYNGDEYEDGKNVLKFI
ncbi:putative nucleosome assembly protein (NAP) [Rosa chinensis]|uniref:Putative nucleosome assembly protein (NAP) n=2 Tax=Rosa chinensis TaxID=74649 RepID=A0A2P6PCK5_ROSCH|nr:putative nucleosome assembly protein (NAP) [Rosa chinensis]